MHTLVLHLLRATEEVPEAEDVKAGWLAFAVFLLLAVAVAVLCVSLVRQLRKAQAAKDAGVYGDEPADLDADAGPDPDAGPEPGDTTR